MKINHKTNTKKQCIPPVVTVNIFSAMINAMISVIFAYFLTPIWAKIMSWFKNDKV